MLCNDAFKKVGTYYCYNNLQHSGKSVATWEFRERNCNCWPAAVLARGLLQQAWCFGIVWARFLRSLRFAEFGLQHPLAYKNIENYITSNYPHHDIYTFCYWQISWHSICHIFWHFIWHIFWHSTWHIFWHIIWQIFWHSIWHILWH